MKAVDWPGVAADLAPIECITDRALVRQKSRDFFWYSPVLNERLKGVRGDLLVSPANEDEVVRTLAYCHARRIPVTPRGAGTGNYGQAMPLEGGVPGHGMRRSWPSTISAPPLPSATRWARPTASPRS
jgi:FAD/FMN-containing dehydrogenase